MIKIRMAVEKDAGRLAEIYRPYVEKTAVSFEYQAPSEKEFANRIVHTLKNYPYLVAEDCRGIAGYAYAGPFHTREAFRYDAELSIYLDWNRRRSGIGGMLYRELEALLKKQNLFMLYACIAATDREHDAYLTDDSIRFHEKMGFHLTGRHEKCGYKFHRWYDVVWMEKRIREAGDTPGEVGKVEECYECIRRNAAGT